MIYINIKIIIKISIYTNFNIFFFIILNDTFPKILAQRIMKLNYEVIESAESYINPIKDRELDLTGEIYL